MHDEEACSHHHGLEQDGLDLLEAIHAISCHGNPVYFGPERKSDRISASTGERQRLSDQRLAWKPDDAPNFKGGEHRVWVLGSPPKVVYKQTFGSNYGQTLDESMLLDPRLWKSLPKLHLRPALPSEYLVRWVILRDIFNLPTTYRGSVEISGELNMVISQPYIPQDENDPPELVDVEKFMTAYCFSKVDPKVISITEIQDVTWYRQRDGILISDAFPRNFRKDSDTQAILPIDLVVARVPPGASKLLADAEVPWELPVQQPLNE